MQHLEVSGAVRPLWSSLGVKRLIKLVSRQQRGVTQNKAQALVLQFIIRVSSICDEGSLAETQDVPIKDGWTFLAQ